MLHNEAVKETDKEPADNEQSPVQIGPAMIGANVGTIALGRSATGCVTIAAT